jgi:hypothetical protein
MRTRILRKILLYALLVPAMYTSQVMAEDLKIVIGEQGNRSMSIPERGLTQQEVSETFGSPQRMTRMVGKPPMSTWHYEMFSVYFEDDQVIHAVRRHRSIYTLAAD